MLAALYSLPAQAQKAPLPPEIEAPSIFGANQQPWRATPMLYATMDEALKARRFTRCYFAGVAPVRNSGGRRSGEDSADGLDQWMSDHPEGKKRVKAIEGYLPGVKAVHGAVHDPGASEADVKQ